MISFEPPPGSVVTWFATFPDGGTYQYTAVHIAGRGWYTSCTFSDRPWTWPELAVRIANSPTFVATAWAEIPHVIAGEVVTHQLPTGR